jgi:hypothetical protein
MGPDPELAEIAWAFAVIGGVATPGLCEISAGARVLKWDAAKGYGTSGATTKFVGADLSKFTLKISFYDRVFGLSSFEQRLKWFDEIVPILKTAESGKTAIEFYHPAVSDDPINVRAVVPEKIHQLVQEGELWTVRVDFVQYVKAKPAAGKPAASAKKNQAPTAADKAEAEFVKAANDFNKAFSEFVS